MQFRQIRTLPHKMKKLFHVLIYAFSLKLKLLHKNLKFESKIAVLGGFKPRTAIFLYVLYRPSFKFVKKFFHPWLEL